MKILNLSLENFQGIKKAEFAFDGHSGSIYGDNATGKTTVFNAFTWLLFGKASTNAKNFTPKTKGADGDLHHLDHSVEGLFKLEDGRIISLKKTYKEIYKKKRGSASEEFDGHTTDHFVDGVPVSEKDFNQTVLNISGDQEKVKMLTMPDYFPEEMNWQDRRKILLEMSGDATDEDVIESNPELEGLKEYLLMPGTNDQFYTVDEYQKIAVSKKKQINQELQSIPDRIDEANLAIQDTEGLQKEEIEKEIQILEKNLKALEKEEQDSQNEDSQALAIRKRIAEAKTRIEEARAAYLKESQEKNESTLKEMASLKARRLETESEVSDLECKKRKLENQLSDMRDRRKKLLVDYAEAQKEAWDDSKENCPTCKRPLPEDDIEEMKEDFNLRKSQLLEELNQKGKREASKEMIEKLEAELDSLQKIIRVTEAAANEYRKKEKDLSEKIVSPEPFESTSDFIMLSAAYVQAREEEGSEFLKTSISKSYEEKKQKIKIAIRAQEELLSRLKLRDIQEKRIQELADQEKDLAGEYENIERGIYLSELFIKTKVDLLNDKINEKFQSVSFRLFKEQQNGGIKEDCEVMVPGPGGRMVDYAFANNAARINAGLEIIGALGKHWEISMPVFVDNAESVTKLKHEKELQVIRLVVSEKDKKLRLELDK